MFWMQARLLLLVNMLDPIHTSFVAKRTVFQKSQKICVRRVLRQWYSQPLLLTKEYLLRCRRRQVVTSGCPCYEVALFSVYNFISRSAFAPPCLRTTRANPTQSSLRSQNLFMLDCVIFRLGFCSKSTALTMIQHRHVFPILICHMRHALSLVLILSISPRYWTCSRPKEPSSIPGQRPARPLPILRRETAAPVAWRFCVTEAWMWTPSTSWAIRP